MAEHITKNLIHCAQQKINYGRLECIDYLAPSTAKGRCSVGVHGLGRTGPIGLDFVDADLYSVWLGLGKSTRRVSIEATRRKGVCTEKTKPICGPHVVVPGRRSKKIGLWRELDLGDTVSGRVLHLLWQKSRGVLTSHSQKQNEDHYIVLSSFCRLQHTSMSCCCALIMFVSVLG